MREDVERHIFETNVDTFVGLYTQIKQLQQQQRTCTAEDRPQIMEELKTARSQFVLCWMWLKGYQRDPEYREIIDQNNLPAMAKEILTKPAYRRCKSITPPANRKRVATKVPAKTRKRQT